MSSDSTDTSNNNALSDFYTRAYTDAVIDRWNTDEQLILEQQIQRWPALLSCLCSLYVIVDIVRQPHERVKVANRIVVLLSVCDVLYSFWSPFLGSWPAPVGSAYGAAGSVAACSTAAFFSGLGFYASTYYNASLAICYVLMICYGWNETKLAARRVAWFLYLIPLVIVLPWCILSLAWEGGNYNGRTCGMMQAYPQFCDNELVKCERGGKIVDVFWQNNANTPRGWILMVLPSIVCGPIVVGCMFLLYLYVLRQELANDRYRISVSTKESRRHSQQVAFQGILYVWAYLAVEIPWIVGVSMWAQRKANPALFVIPSILMPLQGWWNAVVYLRPRYWPWIQQRLSCCCCTASKTKGPEQQQGEESATRPISVETLSVAEESFADDDDDMEKGETTTTSKPTGTAIRIEESKRPTMPDKTKPPRPTKPDETILQSAVFLGNSQH
ncbi:expressed unknown protein [Seminavis robusta]|uniref:Uncharacterized protein n=1 Tax=Seminavis robusta TaxID=568900 RepID=A0A9N8HAY6_9STRA|nr:expressed unknown protein [Seminavis robusta]|eukprot:Sro315_g115280.1 n/a (443) ;mRNA; r:26985-28313